MKDRRGQDVMADEMGEIINYPTSEPAATSSLSSFIIIHRATLLCAKKNWQTFCVNKYLYFHAPATNLMSLADVRPSKTRVKIFAKNL